MAFPLLFETHAGGLAETSPARAIAEMHQDNVKTTAMQEAERRTDEISMGAR